MGTLGYQDGEAFIERLEKAKAENDADAITANLARLCRLIADLQEESHRLARLQHRARSILAGHEPTAEQRYADPALDKLIRNVERAVRRRKPPAG